MALIFDEILPSSYRSHTLVDGVEKSVTSFPTTSSRAQLIRTGVKRRKPVGWMPPTAYNMSRFRYQNLTGNRMEKGSVSGGHVTTYYIEGVMGPAPSSSFPSRNTANKQRAEVQALLALKDQKVNLGVAFATAQQTADLVGDGARKIAKLVERLRKARKWDFRRLANSGVRGIPNSLLENQFGWVPTLKDVNGSVEALKRTVPEQFLVTVFGKSAQTTRIDDVLSPGTVLQRRVTGEEETSCRVRLDYTPDNGLFIQLSSLGITNPAVVAWELVPYSFVVDWFLPIGSWLDSLDAAVGYNFRGGSYTYRESFMRNYRYFGDGVDATLWCNVTGWSKGKKLDRGVYSSSPLPRPPSPKNPLSLLHMAEGLALLQRAFR